jgi:uncharacterized membrane protein YkoI
MKLKKSIVLAGIFASVPLLGFASDSPKKGEITMERAKEIAIKSVSGTIKSSEYEFEKGQNVYSFDIAGSDGKLHEVLVSAKHGKIVSSTIESAAKEAAEQKADEKKQ